MKRRSLLSVIAALPVMAATVALGSGRNELPGEKMLTINEKRAAPGFGPIGDAKGIFKVEAEQFVVHDGNDWV